MQHEIQQSREDIETRELIRRAAKGLASSNTRSLPSVHHRVGILNPDRKPCVEPVRRPPGSDEGGQGGGIALVTLVLAIVLIVVPKSLQLSTAHGQVPTTLLAHAVNPDHAIAINAARFVHGLTGTPADGRFLITAVSQSRPNDVEFSAAVIAMRKAQTNAMTAARRCLGSRADTSDMTISAEGFTGGSGGLMFALAVVDGIRGGDLTRGREIAGTGTITADGTVGRVLHVGAKARAAERAGADVFLAPAAQVAEARRATTAMRVASVGTLAHAVRLLTGGPGCALT